MIAVPPVQMLVLLLLVFLGSVSGFEQFKHQFSATKLISGDVGRDGEIKPFVYCVAGFALTMFQASSLRET